jgi:uncharacterized protein (DUF1330 family)
MTFSRTYLATWADPHDPLPDAAGADALAASAREAGGDLLALAPVADIVEVSSRPVPPWGSISRFDDPDSATSWYEAQAKGALTGSAILVPTPAEPIWWPDERTAERPGWSRRGDIPDDRLGLFVSVWIAEVDDVEAMLDYSAHFRWTVERHGGAPVAHGPLPTVLAGGHPLVAMTLLTWPTSAAGLAWYDTADYRPYRDQRHGASTATVVGLPARAGATIPPR